VTRIQPIFVGDVQGCAEELEELLERAEREYGRSFEAWIVGDVVNRGPLSLRALERVRELVDSGRGRCVLGNHELNLLRVAAGQRELSPLDSVDDVLGAPDADEWIEWIRRLPLVERGRLGGQEFAMVHAATHPDWSLDELVARAQRAAARLGDPERARAEAFLAGDPARDPDLDTLLRVTCCRSVGPGDAWSPEPPELAPAGQRAWHELWSERGHIWGVVYGHWSLQGLHVAPGLRGLDTGCVHHGRGRDGFLTAWLPDPDGETPFSVPDERFWSVRAHRAYYARRDWTDSGGTEKSD
jgi:bis(5'-nucleosyl)-tetraphosphatase (symmetrical)